MCDDTNCAGGTDFCCSTSCAGHIRPCNATLPPVPLNYCNKPSQPPVPPRPPPPPSPPTAPSIEDLRRHYYWIIGIIFTLFVGAVCFAVVWCQKNHKTEQSKALIETELQEVQLEREQWLERKREMRVRTRYDKQSRKFDLEEILAELDQDGKGAKIDQDANGAAGDRSKFHGEVKTMETGASGTATHGIMYFMGLTAEQQRATLGKLATGKEAIINEVEQFGTEKDKACLRYIIHDEAGTCKEKFNNSTGYMDCDENCGLLESRRVDGPGSRGKRIQDFVEEAQALEPSLLEEHVIALRLYTTDAYRSINNHLRHFVKINQRKVVRAGADGAATAAAPSAAPAAAPATESTTVDDSAHPSEAWAATITLIAQGIQKLREDTAQDHAIDFFRGVRDLELSDDFLNHGGTEIALMSTTSNPKVALEYATRDVRARSLLLKLRTTSNLQQGADISFLSVFPDEEELLYPPLTHLKWTGKPPVEHTHRGVEYRVYEVEPNMGTLF